jgi:hypothetical protein
VTDVSTEVVPYEPGPPITEALRQRGVDVLQGLYARGEVDQEQFQQALDGLLGVRDEAAFAVVIRSLPPPVALTPSRRRRLEPFEISASMGEVRLEGRWQVSRRTTISAGMGAVLIDLSDAEFDDWDVEIVVRTTMGAITVVAPPGFDVRLVGRNGPVTTSVGPPIPGFPVVRLSAMSDMGTIRVIHPSDQVRRRRWRRGGTPRRAQT